MSNITHPEMVKGLAKPGQQIIDEMTPNSAHLWHMATGISGEACEIHGALKGKLLQDVDIMNLVEEIGDSEFYLEGYRQGLIEVSREMIIDIESTVIGFLNVPASISSELMYQSGELLDATKKIAIYGKGIDSERINQCLANIEFCLVLLRNMFALDREMCLDANIEKLGVRYEGHNYSNEQAQNRADKVGEEEDETRI